MKKISYMIAILGTAVCFTGCGTVNLASVSVDETDVTAVTTSAAASSAATETSAVTEITEQQAVVSETITVNENTVTALPAVTEENIAAVTAAAATVDSVSVSDRECNEAFSINGSNGYCIYRSKIPYFECSGLTAEIQANLDYMNEYLRQIQIHPVREYESSSDYEYTDFNEAVAVVEANPIESQQITVSYELIDLNEKVSTLKIWNDFYGGGPHGYRNVSAFLIDFSQMNIVSLDDICVSTDEFSSFAVSYFMDKYSDRYEGKTDWNADYLKNSLDINNARASWYIQDNSFFLQFPDYTFETIYAEGAPILELPLFECFHCFNDYGKQLLN